MEGSENESNDIETLKRKILVVDKLLKHKEKLEVQKSELTTENLLKENMISSLKTENSELKGALDEKMEKIKELETERRNQSAKLGHQETVIAKKNCEIINKELEVSDLVRKIENLTTENESLQDKIKNDKAAKKLKEFYEGEKWKYLAEISTLKQENDALREAAKEKEEISNAFRVDLEELEKYKKENLALKKALDESKKDKQIQSLKRKLEKANSEIRKISRGHDVSIASYMDSEDMKPDVSFPLPISNTFRRNRFPIINLKRKSRTLARRIKFKKLGSLLYAEVPCVLNKKPVLSEDIPSLKEHQEENLEWILSSSIGNSFSNKRKIDTESISPPRKKAKRATPKKQFRLESTAIESPKISVRENLSIIQMASDDICEKTDRPSLHRSFHSPVSIGLKPLSSSSPLRVMEKESVDFSVVSLASLPSVKSPEADKSELFFNPNPARTRKAHSVGIADALQARKTLKPRTGVSDEVKSASQNNSSRVKEKESIESSVLLSASPPSVKSPETDKSELIFNPNHSRTRIAHNVGTSDALQTRKILKPQKGISDEVKPASQDNSSRVKEKQSIDLPSVKSPETDKSELFFNPNPSRTRIAHTELQTSKNLIPRTGITVEVKSASSDNSRKTRGVSIPPPTSYSTRRKSNVNTTKDLVYSDTMTNTSKELSARAKILDSGLKIETPSTLGKNLTEAQIAAAKNRMVGRAPPGVASRPSVDGFRSSEPLVKKADGISKANQPKTKLRPKVNEPDIPIPSRKKTMPTRLNVKSSEVTPDEIKETAKSPSHNHEAASSSKITVKESVDSPEPMDTTPSRTANSNPSDTESLVAKPVSETTVPDESSNVKTAGAEDDPSSLRSSLDEDLEMTDESEDESRPREANAPLNGEQKKPEIDAEFETAVNQDEDTMEPDGGEGETTPTKRASIPNTHVKKMEYRNMLDELLGGFKFRERRDNRSLERMRSKIHDKQKTFEYQAYKTILEKNIKRLQEEVTSEILESICAELSQGNDVQMNETMICDALYSFLMEEHKSVGLLSDANPDAPPVTRNQQRVFVLLTALQSKPRFEGVIERMISLIYHGFFGKDRMYNMNMSSILSLGRLFVLCARYVDNLDLMKKFLFDLFFFKSARNHLLVGVLLDLWPEVFERQEGDLPPEQETILWSIFNTGDVKSTSDMKVLETRETLTMRHGYVATNFVAQDMIIRYIELVQKNFSDQDFLTSVKYSLLLLGRGNDYKWVNNRIVSRLLKLLGVIWTEEQDNDQGLLRWVIHTLGLMCRLYPADGRIHLTDMFNSVKELLNMEKRLLPETTECCIKAFLHLGYHLQVQVATFLVSWKPLVPLSPNIRELMEDFVGTRGRKYAEITNNVARTKENKERKFKGVRSRS